MEIKGKVNENETIWTYLVVFSEGSNITFYTHVTLVDMVF